VTASTTQAAAESLCLPFTAEGVAKGQLDDRHLGMLHPQHGTAATRAGAHVKAVEQHVMHVLVAARCFTDDAVSYMAQWVDYDLAAAPAAAASALSMAMVRVVFERMIPTAVPNPDENQPLRSEEPLGTYAYRPC